jgi:hypothetical protein
VNAMDSATRRITALPLTEVWDDTGTVPASRVGAIGAVRVRRLLREEEGLRFVVASVGERLEWISRGRRFDFWKDELAPHLLEPADAKAGFRLEDVNDEYAYTAAEWRLADGTAVVVAEVWH